MLITKGLLFANRTFPNKTAIIDGEDTFTYREFTSRTAKLKAALQNMGIQKGDRIGILMLNNFRYLEIMYAATSFGAIVVPINVRLTAPEVSFILNDANVETLFIHQEFIPMVKEIKENVNSLKRIVLAEASTQDRDYILYESLIHEQSANTLTIEHVNEEDVAGLFYTGGTTGRSKGVMLTHKNLVNNAFHAALNLKYHEKEIYLHGSTDVPSR